MYLKKGTNVVTIQVYPSDGWINDEDNTDFDGPAEAEDLAAIEARRTTWEGRDTVEQSTSQTPEKEFVAKLLYLSTHEDVCESIRGTNETMRNLVNVGVVIL